MITNPATIAKALTGAIIAALAALGTALTDGGVSASEWVAVALAFFVALSTVYAVPNQTAPTQD